MLLRICNPEVFGPGDFKSPHEDYTRLNAQPGRNLNEL